MLNFLYVSCILAATCAVAHLSNSAAPSESPAPATAEADCSTLIYEMMDCMSFLSKGSSETTPEGGCCSGFKNVVETNADCICYALSSSASLGLDINMTKAETLPSVCGVVAPPLSNCNLSSTPTTSPPATSPPVSSTPAPSPQVESPPVSSTPAPSPQVKSPPAIPPAATLPPSSSPSVPPATQPEAAVPSPGGDGGEPPSPSPSGRRFTHAPVPSPNSSYTVQPISLSVLLAVIVISFSIFIDA